MSRDSNGNYTLPSAAFVDGTTADAVPVNANFSDIATAITQSIASTGVTPVTGQIKGFAGSSASPGYAFNADLTTGIELISAGNLGFSSSSVLTAQVSSSGWSSMTLLSPTISSPTFVNTGTAGITGLVLTTPTINGSVGGEISFSATDQIVLPVGSTGARPGSPTAGGVRYNSSTNQMEFYNGTTWVQLGAAPTYTSKTTTGSGTYTPPTGCVYYKVRMCGAGGGGAGAPSGGGGNGGQSSLGSWTAHGGSGGVANGGETPGAGGNGGTNGAGTLIVRLTGGSGGPGCQASSSSNSAGGAGGNNPFGGGAPAIFGSTAASANVNGLSAPANTGGGGSGVGTEVSSSSGGGGGAGEYVEFIVTSPAVVGFSVGTGGTAGNDGTNTGGVGGSGVLLIEEHYC
jgi:hypothetical protein